ncbi:extensin [Ziziphus jujuba]|uniref:Extensin n=1 Tax=Ziziphus jujuba TaxID=326968 RepID=A0A6P4B9F3_ZIZJJ|nr:extensin [Ziziphus jujuba]
MAKIFNHLLSTSLLFALMVLNLPRETVSDEPCPYPCYPPPTGTGTTPTTPTTTTTPPPPPSSQTGFYNPPPGSYYPYNPPPPYGTSFGSSPPPPDPILPYFPFYYKAGLHGTNASSAGNLGRSTLMVALTNLILLLICYFFHSM